MNEKTDEYNENIWKIITKYFDENPQSLVRHHIDSYNDFYKTGIYQIFKEKNPIRIHSAFDKKRGDYKHQCLLYFGGKEGNKIYFGKPVIYDNPETTDSNTHFMYPNEARLRNMNYSMTIHYDIEIEYIDYLDNGELPFLVGGGDDAGDIGGAGTENGMYGGAGAGAGRNQRKKGPQPGDVLTTAAAARIRENTERSLDGTANVQRRTQTIEKVYLGKFPIMVQSEFCILNGFPREMRYDLGECRNDLGGYFIIDGKEKTIIPQEKFGDNILYIRKSTDDKHLYSAEIRSVSENVSKPVRSLSVRVVAPTTTYTYENIVVHIPNVRNPVPLFILFRALGVVSDKQIIETCLLDLNKYENMMDLFIPSIHDAGGIMTQSAALLYIATLTKYSTPSYALEILADYFLPHIGELNFMEKAFYLGHMVFRLLSVYKGFEPATDRDNYKFKRIELVGSLLNDLFREYYTMQQKSIHLGFEHQLYYNKDLYENNLFELIQNNYNEVFKERVVEAGFKKAFKGNWGAAQHTKLVGVVQDLNRLSFNTVISHMRKINLPMDSSVKLVEPRVLHCSQWGFIDPIDTPDGANIGIHKTLAISTYISRGGSREPMIRWMRKHVNLRFVEECRPLSLLASYTKVLINGYWAGVVESPIETVNIMLSYRRHALLPIHASITFEIRQNTIYIYTDAGRVCRPIFYRDISHKKFSIENKEIIQKIRKGEFTWQQLTTGFLPKTADIYDETRIYEINELYGNGAPSDTDDILADRFKLTKAMIDFIDPGESENSLIALNMEDVKENDAKPYTHVEIHESLIFGVMCNQIIFPEHNPPTRNAFSCGQSKQAVSMYHTNYHVRMDKTAVVLNYGQTPLVKSRYLNFINREENPYGENAIVAIMCYTGYNVEDAILINEGSLKRGLFNTTYYTVYETHEETTKNANTTTNKRFLNIDNSPNVVGTKPGYDYSLLNKNGVINENVPVNDKTVLIGLATEETGGTTMKDASKTPKKGQLGVVDKSFITEGEEGKRVAKVRIREVRIPNLGDKFAGRAGQKGTVGLIIPEEDMPFTREGIRPDLIMNPHAIPSRMTIGQLVETVFGKASAMYGGFNDCTAFVNKGNKVGMIGEHLTKVGFHSSGNEILYNGMNGTQIESEIFIGPTYYMRLKHMVKDKINYRALGPRTALTHQPVSGRANDGGLRIGEMERDVLISHGITDFLRESMMERGDKYHMAVCNTTGMLAIYNPSKNLFLSPMADGPIRFNGNVEGDNMTIEQITKFGRSFSIVCVPYSLKLLIQELATMNIQMRIITEDNIDQIENLAFSKNLDVQEWILNVKRKLKGQEEPALPVIGGGGAHKKPHSRDTNDAPAPLSIHRPVENRDEPMEMNEDIELDAIDLDATAPDLNSFTPTMLFPQEFDNSPLPEYEIGEYCHYKHCPLLENQQMLWQIVGKTDEDNIFYTIETTPNKLFKENDDCRRVVLAEDLTRVVAAPSSSAAAFAPAPGFVHPAIGASAPPAINITLVNGNDNTMDGLPAAATTSTNNPISPTTPPEPTREVVSGLAIEPAPVAVAPPATTADEVLSLGNTIIVKKM